MEFKKRLKYDWDVKYDLCNVYTVYGLPVGIRRSCRNYQDTD